MKMNKLEPFQFKMYQLMYIKYTTLCPLYFKWLDHKVFFHSDDNLKSTLKKLYNFTLIKSLNIAFTRQTHKRRVVKSLRRKIATVLIKSMAKKSQKQDKKNKNDNKIITEKVNIDTTQIVNINYKQDMFNYAIFLNQFFTKRNCLITNC